MFSWIEAAVRICLFVTCVACVLVMSSVVREAIVLRNTMRLGVRAMLYE